MENNNQYISLLELQDAIKESVEDSFLKMVWICGTIAQVSVNSSGHCYITLTENDENGIVAKANAIIWASSYRVIKPFFESTTGEALSEGMKILVKARVQYSQLYGLSLIINDIDPVFTVGEAFLEKQKTIERLSQEGMMDMNPALEIPTLPRRIAVISAQTAAGYGDFMNHITNTDFGFTFQVTLFPAPMQGKEAPEGIVAALDEIASHEEDFDVVVIMRGGGSSTDLACFDDYNLAVNIAQFPLPIITAIGHERDYHVADMVAHTSVKTPTASADFFIDLFATHLANINSLATRLLIALKSKKSDALNQLEMLKMRIANNISTRVAAQDKLLDMLELRVKALNPEAILSRGFALPLKDGLKVDSVNNLEIDTHLTLLMKDGSVEVNVLKINKNQNG